MNDASATPAAGLVERRWARVQAISGLAFGSFLILHLANSVSAALGPEVYDGLQTRLRLYYQNPVVEIVAVAAAALVHATSGLVRWRRRRKRRRLGTQERAPGWLRWHRASGYFLLLVIVGHAAATRGPSLLLDVPVDLSYLHFSLATWPVVMLPYYAALFSAGAYHGLFGATAALRLIGLRLPWGLGASPLRTGVLALTLAGGLLGILGMAGALHEVSDERFPEFRALYETWLPFMRTW